MSEHSTTWRCGMLPSTRKVSNSRNTLRTVFLVRCCCFFIKCVFKLSNGTLVNVSFLSLCFSVIRKFSVVFFLLCHSPEFGATMCELTLVEIESYWLVGPGSITTQKTVETKRKGAKLCWLAFTLCMSDGYFRARGGELSMNEMTKCISNKLLIRLIFLSSMSCRTIDMHQP